LEEIKSTLIENILRETENVFTCPKIEMLSSPKNLIENNPATEILNVHGNKILEKIIIQVKEETPNKVNIMADYFQNICNFTHENFISNVQKAFTTYENPTQIDFLINKININQNVDFNEIRNITNTIFEKGALNLEQQLQANIYIKQHVHFLLSRHKIPQSNIGPFNFTGGTFNFKNTMFNINELVNNFADIFFLFGHDICQVLSNLINEEPILITFIIILTHLPFLLAFAPFKLINKIHMSELSQIFLTAIAITKSK
jgi:hypothetical protein